MSDFWGSVLGTTQPAPAAPVTRPSVGGYSPSPFFPPSQPSQAPSEALEQPEGPEVPGQWGNVEKARQRAHSARLTDTCPECFSGNYFAPQGMPNAMPQCYECGYNPRFPQQSGASGMPSSSGEGAVPVRQSRQLDASGTSHFHGQTYRIEEGGAGRV